MAKTTTEKAVCDKCGADVREDTAFCYNCGGMIGGEVTKDNTEILPELPVVPKEEKMSRAAEQRRKARVDLRKSNEYTWEPTQTSPLVLIVAVLIAVAALAIVFVTVYWK